MLFDHLNPLEFDRADEAMQNLEQLGEGMHLCGQSGGWIEVEKENDSYVPFSRNRPDIWRVLWTTDKTTHHRHSQAVQVEYLDGHIKNVLTSAIGMWFEYKRPDRLRYAVWLANKIAKAAERKEAVRYYTYARRVPSRWWPFPTKWQWMGMGQTREAREKESALVAEEGLIEVITLEADMSLPYRLSNKRAQKLKVSE